MAGLADLPPTNTTARTFNAGDILTLWVHGNTASGNCTNVTLYYGSASKPTNITVLGPVTG